MKDENIVIIVLIVCILILVGALLSVSVKRVKQSEEIILLHDTSNLYNMELTEDNFYYVCNIYSIKYPEIVFAQARLESGNFSSDIYLNNNNCLGIYNSLNNEYKSYNHWTECLLDYKQSVQNKYFNNHHYYYQFLKELPYAKDTNYINKLKTITK